MLGVCSTIARVGGISAPWIAVYLPDQVLNLTLHPPPGPTNLPGQGSLSAAVPLYIFGASSAVAGLLAALCLTESLGSPLPNTFKVVEHFMAYYDCSSGPGEDEGQCQASLEVCLANEGGVGVEWHHQGTVNSQHL